MLKVIALSKCTLCTNLIQMPFMCLKNQRTLMTRFKTVKLKHSKNINEEQVFLSIKNSHISSVRLLLEKFNIDTSELNDQKMIYFETYFSIEKKIMLLQEIGVPKITVNHIINFNKMMYLSVKMFKANFAIDANINFAQKLFSFVENTNLNYQDLSDLNENMSMKQYYAKCLAYYLQNELDLNEDQLKSVSCQKFLPILYNSFRLLEKTLEILKNSQMTTPKIMRKRWIFGSHPDQILTVLKILVDDLKLTEKVVFKCPKILNHDIDDLKTLVHHFKQYEISKEMLQNCNQIFAISSAEFKKRVESILSKPFTLVYQKHPRFLLLVRDYHVIIPRIRYLEEKHIKFATINSLTTFHNYMEQLISKKKVNITNLKSFLASQFGDKYMDLLTVLRKHPYSSYAPLVQMYETTLYLKELYPLQVIHKQIYAILYSKVDLQAAYEVIMEDPYYSKMQQHHLLALCIYKIEEKCHFTGEAVLTPEKFAETLKEESTIQDKSQESNNKEE